MEKIDTFYCDGRWVPVDPDATLAAYDPCTERQFASVAVCDASAVDLAVAAARRAFDGWSATPVAERCAALGRVRDAMAREAEAFAADLATEIGAPLWVSRQMQVPMPLRNLELAIEAIGEMSLETRVEHSLIVREPVGVVAAITPWNFPLHQIVAKVGAALAAGCTVVLKPSELAPLAARRFARIVHEARLPPGVFNLVWGDGPRTGAALAAHPDVDMVSFTGSVAGGRAVAHVAADTVKKLALELGGKSATILLDDAPLADAVQTVLRQCFTNSGQICAAQTRLLVPRARLAEVEAECAKYAQGWTVGDPVNPGTRLGPVANQRQFETVQRHIETALAEGARLVAGGPGRPEGHARGYFVRATVFSGVTPHMSLAREEVFGPVLALMAYDDEDEAVAIANGTPYGLSGGVWSADAARALAVARRLRTGQVVINGAPQNLAAPFGGYRQSGIGRENGRYGVEEFFELKAIQGGCTHD
ncbi:3-succinoylsemialdehyde-pyridine dehydrogenase [Paraburkholderia caffeinitolerans]|uniref:aldehyde dehydrogenase (NAD(+)) n=1 Tax=Paraburkholderia caffeinitolerans TaxID=1723730 RepID=A0A6J5GH04_9BURK|nr:MULTISPECIES: aldehyde dehydrogenase family protein [Paraburkholderia]CAB3798800.1 3-succinoylsemialdehyde-pyridine dehydrogenase [Paraburkholderia caffeinitolerans]